MGDLVKQGIGRTRRQRVAKYARYDPLHIRIENRYWSAESKRKYSRGTIVPQAWSLQQTGEVAGYITVAGSEQPRGHTTQGTGPLALQPHTRQILDQLFFRRGPNLLQTREPDQEVNIHPVNSCRSRPLEEELGNQYFVGRPISPPRELTEVLNSPSEDMVSEGLAL